MDQCDDFLYRVKRYNARQKLELNFIRDPPPLLEGVSEDIVEAYQREDTERDNAGDEGGGEGDGVEAPAS